MVLATRTGVQGHLPLDKPVSNVSAAADAFGLRLAPVGRRPRDSRPRSPAGDLPPRSGRGGQAPWRCARLRGVYRSSPRRRKPRHRPARRRASRPGSRWRREAPALEWTPDL